MCFCSDPELTPLYPFEFCKRNENDCTLLNLMVLSVGEPAAMRLERAHDCRLLTPQHRRSEWWAAPSCRILRITSIRIRFRLRIRPYNKQCYGSGSGIRCLFDLWIRDGLKSRFGSGMNISDHIFKGLETIFWVKILKFFDADPDSWIFLTLDPGFGVEKFGSGIRDKHPGSATLKTRLN